MTGILVRIVVATVALILGMVLWLLPASGETAQLVKSTVTLQATAHHQAAAELLFVNHWEDGWDIVQRDFNMALGDVSCVVRMVVGAADPDTVMPDCPGFKAEPMELTIPDGSRGVILLFPLNYLGS